MEPKPIINKATDYSDIRRGVKLNKHSDLNSFKNIRYDKNGKFIIKEKCIIRADLAQIKFGKYVIINEKITIHPPFVFKKNEKQKIQFVSFEIGDYVSIGSHTVVQAASIGSNVIIGKDCILSHRCVIHDNVRILDNSIVPPDAVIPPYSIYGGKPALYIAELPEQNSNIVQSQIVEEYHNFVSGL